MEHPPARFSVQALEFEGSSGERKWDVRGGLVFGLTAVCGGLKAVLATLDDWFK